jgi:sterol desaturase/sphingolipid hydroxylase (fatty acid hydroxylase superfamily)
MNIPIWSELGQSWQAAVEWLASYVIAPALQAMHVARWTDSPEEIARFFLLTVIQVLVIALIFRPMESIWPEEHWPDRKLAARDRTYTLLKLLGVLPLFTFAVLAPLGKMFGGGSDDPAGLISIQGLFPWFNLHPWWLFLVYFAIGDFTQYLTHRLQHAIPWWWALHSLHHSQRQLSCWSNDRDHYFDDFLEAMILTLVGMLIGVSPTEYALLVLFFALLENFSHANVRLRFGPAFDKLLVSPHFHRLHHMVMDPQRPRLHNCNFSLVFPVWDLLFGTANYQSETRPTGISDPMVDADNRLSLVGQQIYVFRRFWRNVFRRVGWQPGDVSFGPDLIAQADGAHRLLCHACRPQPFQEDHHARHHHP